MKIDNQIKAEQLRTKLERFWGLSAEKIMLIEKNYDNSKGSPVFTVEGRYSTRGWTEWTQGFQYGSELLQFDATGEKRFLTAGQQHTLNRMAPHLSHTGVHDHGFNNVSTYGNLHRLMKEGKSPWNEWERHFCELALKISGAVQANRWTKIKEGGFIYSFNGPHSLFVDTIRSVRILLISHLLGHVFQGENDRKISLAERAVQHLLSTARYSVYYGEGRDRFDVRGRTSHESVFNVNDGNYRCPSTQQGYSAFTTWTRGLAWAICGFAEELEVIDRINTKDLGGTRGKELVESALLKAAQATCDFYIENTPVDGIPYWDTGAPGLCQMGDYLNHAADPFNQYEPVDSSAAAIAAQGLLRLGHYFQEKGKLGEGERYWQAGLTVLDILLDEPYISNDGRHQGLILHSVYHWPNGWDHVPEGKRIPCGESSMWGDYHAREVALYLQRIIDQGKYYSYFSGLA